MLITKGSTNVSVELEIFDDTDGTPETGVVWNTAGIDLWYRRDGATVTSITEATLAALTTAHTDGGFLHISHGVYRFDVPDAAFASGVDKVVIGGTVTGMVVRPVVVQLTDIDIFDAVRAGMTALPNAAADAAGGLPISDAGGLDLDTQLAATNEVTAARMGALTDWIDGGRLDLLLDAIPTTAMRGTDNAALASVATEARLAELDAANLPADIDTIVAATLAAAIKAAVLPIFDTDTQSEPPAATAPTDTPTIIQMLDYMYSALIHGLEVDTVSGFLEFKNAAGTVIWKKSIADAGGIYTEGDAAAGP